MSGKISFYTLPPSTHTLPTHLSAEIVKEMTEVFDIEDTEQANEDTMECLATGESDELLGDMDPLEMEIKWLHSPMVKIADAMENKTTVYKIEISLGIVPIQTVIRWGGLSAMWTDTPETTAQWKSAQWTAARCYRESWRQTLCSRARLWHLP